ncbi:MAG: S-layer homology domain-containing protein [Oscillospiraceae bacterium]|nr:S-layer homology domain-containing protein [Oscillospiraceae bacterium]
MTKYGEAYGMNGVPWCVESLWYWFDKAGERMAFFGGGKTASCSMLLRWYREQGLTVPVEQVRAGDIVILNFHGTKDTEHCGLVTGISDIKSLSTGMPYSVWTIEGNTSSGNGSQDNGGMVAEKIRYPSQIVAVCRPQYQPEPQTVDDVTGHWAEKDIRFWLSKGLVKGYPDGSFQPDKPVTRAELCVVMERFRKMLLQLGDDEL